MPSLEIVKEGIVCKSEVNFKDLKTYIIDRGELINSVMLYKNSGFNFLLDIVAIDYLEYENEEARFALVYTFRNDIENLVLALKVYLKDGEDVDTISHIYKAADWLEREAYDQFGIKFNGHKNLKRILNHIEFVGHPLRKDYDIRAGQPLFKSDNLHDEIFNDCKRRGLIKDNTSFEEAVDDIKAKLMFLNIGPSHPATHGAIRTLVGLDGENIVASAVEVGYLHRGFEKSCENHTYNQIIPYTDRLNYCSSLVNNIAFALTIEKMLGVKVPNRAVIMRVILLELQRIMDHLVCLAALCTDSGAITNYFYLFNERDVCYDFLSKLTGARLTNSFARVGGMARDFHIGWEEQLKDVLTHIETGVGQAKSLIDKNRIFLDRVDGVCPISKEDILSYSLTGPVARASGVDNDLRKIDKDFDYTTYDFDVPLGTRGDLYDRVFIRFEEINESIKIIRQAMDRIPKGEVRVSERNIFLPQRKELLSSIEGMINHFKLVFEGVHVPKGEYYSSLESPNGELGFYVVSDGSGHPYRVKVRPPSFFAIASHGETIINSLVADSILNLGSLNIIAGESDR